MARGQRANIEMNDETLSGWKPFKSFNKTEYQGVLIFSTKFKVFIFTFGLKSNIQFDWTAQFFWKSCERAWTLSKNNFA